MVANITVSLDLLAWGCGWTLHLRDLPHVAAPPFFTSAAQ
jgi:nitrogen fixation protein